MDAPGYPLFDNHYYEREDAFTRHGDESVKRCVRWLSEGKRKHIVFGNVMGTAIPNPTFNPIGKPGAYHRRLKELAEEASGAMSTYHPNTGTRSPYRHTIAIAMPACGSWTSRMWDEPHSSRPLA